MPRVHQLLASAGVTCPDCPGPNQLPPTRSVKYAEIIPYVLAYIWPVEVDSGGGVSMRICAGINGIEAIKAPDPGLAAAGFDLVFGNWNAIDEAMRCAKETAQSPECRKLDPEARVTSVRRSLAEVLPSDTRFQEALRPAIKLLPEIGLECSDCPGPPEDRSRSGV
jgi:hypothetical protein